VHMAGGFADSNGLYHDTHAHAVPAPVLALLQQLTELAHPPGVLIERDDRYPSDAALNAELDAVATICRPEVSNEFHPCR